MGKVICYSAKKWQIRLKNDNFLIRGNGATIKFEYGSPELFQDLDAFLGTNAVSEIKQLLNNQS